MMPQFQSATYKLTAENIAVGLSLFSFGLFKKVVLADSMAPFVTTIYDGVDAGAQVSLIHAWMAAIGFVLQIYFLESLGFAQNFLSGCELEALHFIGIGSFGEEFREDVVFRGIQEQFRKPLA
jgi:hypothetical protein